MKSIVVSLAIFLGATAVVSAAPISDIGSRVRSRVETFRQNRTVLQRVRTNQPVRQAVAQRPVRRTIEQQPVRRTIEQQPVRRTIAQQPVRRTIAQQPVRQTLNRTVAAVRRVNPFN